MSDIEDRNYGGRVIDREGIEEFSKNDEENIQDKRRLMKTFTEQNIEVEREEMWRKNGVR